MSNRLHHLCVLRKIVGRWWRFASLRWARASHASVSRISDDKTMIDGVGFYEIISIRAFNICRKIYFIICLFKFSFVYFVLCCREGAQALAKKNRTLWISIYCGWSVDKSWKILINYFCIEQSFFFSFIIDSTANYLIWLQL